MSNVAGFTIFFNHSQSKGLSARILFRAEDGTEEKISLAPGEMGELNGQPLSLEPDGVAVVIHYGDQEFEAFRQVKGHYWAFLKPREPSVLVTAEDFFGKKKPGQPKRPAAADEPAF